MEEEALQEEEEVEKEAEEEATHPRDPQEARRPEETQSPPDLTSQLTYDLSPALRTHDQWGSSPMFLTAIEPKQKRSSTN